MSEVMHQLAVLWAGVRYDTIRYTMQMQVFA